MPLIANRKFNADFNFHGFGSWEKFYLIACSTHSRIAVSIKSFSNDKFITVNNHLLLTASKNDVNSWERFYIEKNTDGTYSLRVNANSKLVCAENYGKNNLVANRNAIQCWEKFYIVDNHDKTYSFKSQNNRNYVSSENTTLIANKNGIGNFEKFYLLPLPQNNGVLVTLKSLANNKFLSFDTQSSVLNLNSEKTRSEKFCFDKHPDGNYSIRAFNNNKYFFENIDKSNLEASKDRIEDATKFTIIKNSDGSYSLKTLSSRKYMSCNDNTVLLINKKTAENFERFNFENASHTVKSIKDFFDEKVFNCPGKPICFCSKCLNY